MIQRRTGNLWWNASRAVAVAVLVLLASCKSKEKNAPLPGESMRRKEPAFTPAAGQSEKPRADNRRLLFAQVVEDDDPRDYKESAILEGRAFKYFLKQVAATSHDNLRKDTNMEVTFEGLMHQPGMYRGQVVTLQRGVVVEVSKAKLPPEYGLPEGYTVLPAIFVDSARDVYAVRILCGPESKLYDKLKKGIDDDAFPVLRISGYFMKLYARKTNRKEEPPWRRPLLICPEPEFSQAVEPRQVWKDMEDAKVVDLLPSERIPAPGAEERLVVELLAARAGSLESRIRAEGRDAPNPKDLRAFLADAVASLKKRLPQDELAHPAAVILIGPKAPRERLDEILAGLRAAGVQRLAIKREE